MAQRLLWMLDHDRAGNGGLNYPLLLALTGDLDRAALATALTATVARHEALRTTFERRGGRLLQLIHAPAPVELIDGGPLTPDTLDAAIEREITTPVNPRRECVRATLWSPAPGEHVLCVNVHHLNVDAWSAQIIAEELGVLLAGGEDLAPVVWQARHAIEWRRRQGASDDDARDYWTRQLDGATPVPLRIETDGSAAPGRALPLPLSPTQTAALRRAAHDHGTTLFNVALSAVAATVAQAYGIDDVCLAVPFANRVHPATMRTVGMFANLVILRIRVEHPPDVAQVLRQTVRVVAEARPHQHFPYAVLPAAAHGPRRLEDVVFQLLPPLTDPVDCGAIRLRVLPPRLASRFPLELTMISDPDGVHGLVQYAPARVDEAVARRIADGVGEAISPTGRAASVARA